MIARQLFVLLILLNLAAGAWWLFHRDPVAAAPVADGTPVLRLAGESAASNAGPAGATPGASPTASEAAAPAATMASSTPASPANTAFPADAVCAAFGPFADATAAQAARTTLEPRVLRLQARQVAQQGRGYNVIIPPLASPDAVAALVERLRAAGVNDLFVIRDGADANGIALGRFGSAEAAQRRAAELQAKGFAQVRAQPAGRAVFWLDAAASAGFDLEASRRAIAAPQAQRMACSTPAG